MAAISVVIAARDPQVSLRACLEAVLEQSGGGEVEILVATNLPPGDLGWLGTQFAQVKVIHAAPHALTPELWKAGYLSAKGETIAFTNAILVPLEGWLASIEAAFRKPIAAVGGPILEPANGGSLIWALYLARYSAYLPPGPSGPTRDLAGDNAAYRKSVLVQCQAEMRDGFWETLVHTRLLADGNTLIREPKMQARLLSVESLQETARQRFVHGRYYGSTRPAGSLGRRILRLVSSPLIPAVLFVRIARRVLSQRPEWFSRWLGAAPALLFLVSAWSLGEMFGYLNPRHVTTGDVR